MTYMSRFARPLSDAEINEIGFGSVARNAADDISGVLLTLDSVFFQIIEGPEDKIDDLYARVLRDDRHTDIICLRTETDVIDRLFPNWSMNVLELDQLSGEVIEPLKLLLHRLGETQAIVEKYAQPAVSQVLADGLNPLDIPLRKVERVVLFTDMVGFSSISDRLPIEQVSELVSVYFETCSRAIVSGGGVVSKLLGDGVMAYFDAHAVDDALQACVDASRELLCIRQSAAADSALRLLYSGFGLAMGSVLEGSMGSSVKMDYTIIGEPVNSAARVEALTRTIDAPIVMTDDVRRAASESWTINSVGRHDIGRDRPTPLYALDEQDGGVMHWRSVVADLLTGVAVGR